MKRTIRWSIPVLAVLAALTLAVVQTTVAPPEAEAVPNCRCMNFRQQTAIMKGDRPTCAEAKAQLATKLHDAAAQTCGPEGTCNEEVIITSECTTNPDNGWQWVMGYLEYSCIFCLD